MERRPDRDHIGEERQQHAFLLCELVFELTELPGLQRCCHLGLAGGDDRLVADRHPAVQPDDQSVQQQPRQDEREPGAADVAHSNRHEQRVGGEQRPERNPAPGRATRHRHELQGERDRQQWPPRELHLEQACEVSAGGEADEHGDDEDGQEQQHGRFRDSPLPRGRRPLDRGGVRKGETIPDAEEPRSGEGPGFRLLLPLGRGGSGGD